MPRSFISWNVANEQVATMKKLLNAVREFRKVVDATTTEVILGAWVVNDDASAERLTNATAALLDVMDDELAPFGDRLEDEIRDNIVQSLGFPIDLWWERYETSCGSPTRVFESGDSLSNKEAFHLQKALHLLKLSQVRKAEPGDEAGIKTLSSPTDGRELTAGYLDLMVDRERREVRRSGDKHQENFVKLSGDCDWHTFLVAFDAGPTGATNAQWERGYPGKWDARRKRKSAVQEKLVELDVAFSENELRLIPL